jgi:hypothetical protein
MSETPTHTSPAYAGRRVTSATIVRAGLIATIAALIGTFAVAQVALAAGASDKLTALTPARTDSSPWSASWAVSSAGC